MTVFTFMASTHLDKGICSPGMVILRVLAGRKAYSVMCSEQEEA